MDDKQKILQQQYSLLDTPQINSFKHENNVFGLEFKEATRKVKIEANDSIGDFSAPQYESATKANNSNQSSNASVRTPPNSSSSSSSSMSSVSGSISSSLPSTTNSSFSSSSSANGFNSSISNDMNINAPKKQILFRTISQTDAENQKKDLASKSPYSPNHFAKPPLLSNQLSFEYNAIESPISENKKFTTQLSIEAKKLHEKLLKENGDYDHSMPNQYQLLEKTLEIITQNSPTLNRSSFTFNSLSPNSASRQLSNSQTMQSYISANGDGTSSNINSPMDANSDTTYTNSRNSPSSIDEMVTSSDQTNEKKTVSKRRSIHQNTDSRKEQIRNSNREAARRCRERRRNYIETLETKLRNVEAKQEALINENNLLHKEVATLKRLLVDYKTNTNVTLNGIKQPKKSESSANYYTTRPSMSIEQQQQQQMNVPLLVESNGEVYENTNATKVNDMSASNRLNLLAVAATTSSMPDFNNNSPVDPLTMSLSKNGIQLGNHETYNSVYKKLFDLLAKNNSGSRDAYLGNQSNEIS